MKAIGIIRKIDDLGRIVIPKEMRITLDIKEDDPIEITAESDRIILRKYMPNCIFCMSHQKLTEYKGKTVCKNCLDELAAQ